ncbi:peptidoglycan-binding protein [Calothrix sp. FACHB-1219]|uniref:peptidoglycan-binding protein n=1 Tax=unclassified Calothrix TaxID=2619626 RepID=UPI00168A163C|nr:MULTISPECIES: peptidoglycan-binding protein [unclassified Calothrix]MBD2206241.1 peptidoglycan-binding protein [Calothrix sp. FACHB-168]MBD2219137.1 peptidoglycan-binding protein [Calothrix sp. FACHB-1219]
MNIQGFVGTKEKYSVEAIAQDSMLAYEIQEILIEIGDLQPPSGEESLSEKGFDDVCIAALLRFQAEYLPETSTERLYGFFGTETASSLIDAKPNARAAVQLKSSKSNGKSQTGDMASRIYNYMVKKGYTVFTERQEYNIVYIEGMNVDLTLNDDRPNSFNDLRLVLEIQEGKPVILDQWEGTTEPGVRYTNTPLNPKGAARIKFGQYRAWQVGTHQAGKPTAHEALVQTGGEVNVHRDFDKNFLRTNDKIDTGFFGINQHWGFDFPQNDIKTASAGCLVGRTTAGHRQFMELVKQDKRYQADKKYTFYSTVIAGDDLMKPENDVTVS